MQLDKFRCAMCGTRGTSFNSLEVHHMNYKHIYEEDVSRDLVTLCSACHRSVHNMMNRPTGNGKFGWKSEPNVPKIHVFNLGNDTHFETE